MRSDLRVQEIRKGAQSGARAAAVRCRKFFEPTARNEPARPVAPPCTGQPERGSTYPEHSGDRGQHGRRTGRGPRIRQPPDDFRRAQSSTLRRGLRQKPVQAADRAAGARGITPRRCVGGQALMGAHPSRSTVARARPWRAPAREASQVRRARWTPLRSSAASQVRPTYIRTALGAWAPAPSSRGPAGGLTGALAEAAGERATRANRAPSCRPARRGADRPGTAGTAAGPAGHAATVDHRPPA